MLSATIDPVRAEADQSRLQVEGSFPWETVRTEWTVYRIVHEDAPIAHQLSNARPFYRLRLSPPVVLSSSQEVSGEQFFI